MVINKKIAFIPIPKNASWSVEDTCISYGFELKYPNTLWENSINLNVKDSKRHLHSTIDSLIYRYGTDLEYFCILRDSTDRFVSGWKYFIGSVIYNLKGITEEFSNELKSKDNAFVINFIKNNYSDFINVYGSFKTRKKFLIKLLTELKITDNYPITEDFIKLYSMHMLMLVSQYQWILNDKVKVKEFKIEKIYEFENYMSEKLDVNFKLIHKNSNNLDFCAVSKTPELINFVDTYIDGMYKKTKSII